MNTLTKPCAQHLGPFESADNLSAVIHPTPILMDGGAPFHPFDNRPHQYPNRHGTAVSGFVLHSQIDTAGEAIQS